MRALITILAGLLLSVAAAAQTPADGLITISVASLRSAPSHAAELETQALLGTPVKILERNADWYRVSIPNGYKAWVPASSVITRSRDAIARWEQSPRVIVTAIPGVTLTSDTLPAGSGNTVSDLVAGDVLALDTRPASGTYLSVSLPDGRKGFIPSPAVASYDDFAAQTPLASTILDVAGRLNGVPYLWGGNSPKALDCSGLTSLAYFMAGVQLPRNASQQARIGEEVDKSHPESFKAADLVFFANPRSGRVNHVGIAMGDGRIIHSSGRVKINSLHPSDANYIGRPIHSVRRILGTADARRVR